LPTQCCLVQWSDGSKLRDMNATNIGDAGVNGEDDLNVKKVQAAVAIYTDMTAERKDFPDRNDLAPSRVTFRLLRKFRSIQDPGKWLEALTRIYCEIPLKQRTAKIAGPVLDSLIGAYG